MQAEKELAQFSPGKGMLLTIGVFDGIHLGHKYLISQLKEQAKERDLLSGVVTFKQHPLEVLSPGTGLPYLTSIEEKVALLKKEGVDAVIALTFTRELAGVSARQFVTLLKKHLRMCGLVIGPDFALGRNREGDAGALGRLGEEMGFTVTVVTPKKINGDVVSSTLIRQALANGDVKRVSTLIGRPFSLQGRVTTGVGRGAGLGFPTANLEVDTKRAIPSDGVYATLAHIDGKSYQAITNIGLRPTFDGKGRTIETYILDYQDNLYGRQLKIEIIGRIRSEKKFESADALKQQIAEDIKQGRAILNSRGN
jgi:riboflavin kinase/FMN adenylyltransferase